MSSARAYHPRDFRLHSHHTARHLALYSLVVPGLLMLFAGRELACSTLPLDRSGPVDTLRIDIQRRHSRQLHAITFDEIVSLRDIREVSQSPDGRTAALLLRQAFRDCNCYRIALYVTGAPNGEPIKLLEEDAISHLRWAPDGHSLSYLCVRNGVQEVWRIDRWGHSASRVLSAHGVDMSVLEFTDTAASARPKVSIKSFEWSPDGSRLAYVITPQPNISQLEAVARRGVVYDDDQMSFLTLLHQRWLTPRAELWIYEVRDEAEFKVWTAPEIVTLPWSVGISNLAWAPNGQSLAVSYQAPGINKWPVFINFDLGILSLPDNRFTALATSLETSELNPSWSPDGRQIAFSAQADAPRSSLGVIDLVTQEIRYVGKGATGRAVSGIWWGDNSSKLIFEAESPTATSVRVHGGLIEIPARGGEARRLTTPTYDVSKCGNAMRRRVFCVVQTSSMPPDLAVIDTEDGSSGKVTQVNPELANVRLAPVSEIRWTPPGGTETNGFLVKPLGYVRGMRYPLLIILYGFSGRFIGQAEWIPNYPAQVFAAEGFAVLLANFPWWGNWDKNSFDSGARDGYGTLASLESVIGQLTSAGLINPEQVGIMGLSRGAFYAHFAITHSSLFKAASIANGGDFNPGTYWLSGFRAQREYYEHFLGGPPYGSSLSNWLDYSPAFNAHRVKGPVLLEFDLDEAFFGLEIATGLRRYGVPVEFVVYPGAGHVFTPPDHRFHSMQRNSAWFKFWLQGKHDITGDRCDDVARWNRMLNSAEALTKRHNLNAPDITPLPRDTASH